LKHIDKLVGTLRDDEELKEVLKRKFTKTEKTGQNIILLIEQKERILKVNELNLCISFYRNMLIPALLQ
ncbi:MAG: hypothetical protein PHE08_12915, partial [Bacteroidales bacterium]|nr:hypothetical protein [Bacteroidales bacterium]